MMDMPKDEKEPGFECPACGAKLNVEKAEDEANEAPLDMPAKPPVDKNPADRADKMPMDKLKSVLMSAKKPEPMGM
jgi:uncharacterized Zn finger protein (UPF0148 family)